MHCYNGNPSQFPREVSNPRSQKEKSSANASSHRDISRTPPSKVARSSDPVVVPMEQDASAPLMSAETTSMLNVMRATVAEAVEQSVQRAMQPFAARLDALSTQVEIVQNRVADLESRMLNHEQAATPSAEVSALMQVVTSLERGVLQKCRLGLQLPCISQLFPTTSSVERKFLVINLDRGTAYARSIFGLLPVHNMLPDHVANAASVSLFQGLLHDLVKRACEASEIHWPFLSPHARRS
jgi:hypothetical protein